MNSPWGYGTKAGDEVKAQPRPVANLDGLLIADLIIAGRLCANCCFNLGQTASPVPNDRNRQSMMEAYKAWDDACTAFMHATKGLR